MMVLYYILKYTIRVLPPVVPGNINSTWYHTKIFYHKIIISYMSP